MWRISDQLIVFILSFNQVPCTILSTMYHFMYHFLAPCILLDKQFFHLSDLFVHINDDDVIAWLDLRLSGDGHTLASTH